MADERKGVVTFRGNPVTLSGPGIKVGQPAPDFSAVDTSLGTAKLADARGKVLILSSVPSLDTPVCDTETRRFNEEAAAYSALRAVTKDELAELNALRARKYDFQDLKNEDFDAWVKHQDEESQRYQRKAQKNGEPFARNDE